LCYLGLKEHLEAQAESLLAGGPVPDHEICIRSESGKILILETTGVLDTVRLRGGVLKARGQEPFSLVVKLGPAPELVHLGDALCDPAERFLQVSYNSLLNRLYFAPFYSLGSLPLLLSIFSHSLFDLVSTESHFGSRFLLSVFRLGSSFCPFL
jgi:hypothetical protein